MKPQLRRIPALVLVSSLLILSSCGGSKGKSSSISVTINPKRPIVITGDSIDSTGKAIKAPWFKFNVSMNNPTDEDFTIVGMQAEITAIDSTGLTVTSTVTWTPAEYNYTYSDTISCSYTTFGTIPAGTDTDTPLYLSDLVTQCDGKPGFIAGNNPSGPTKSNFVYHVKLKPLGYFGTEGNATDRLEKYKYFSTQ